MQDMDWWKLEAILYSTSLRQALKLYRTTNPSTQGFGVQFK